jgi:hypothetical protein
MGVSIKAALLILALAYFIDWLCVATWTLWIFETAFAVSDHCFTNNPWLVKMFSAVEDRDLNRAVKIPPTLMAEIQAKDYSFEALRLLSQDWKQPVVVRGLFSTTSAIQRWSDAEYLIGKVFGQNETSVIYNGTLAHTYERVCPNGRHFTTGFSREYPFDQALRGIMSGSSTETIVFPPASRSKRVRNAPLEQVFNRLVDEDLELHRIGGTFATGISNTALTQMFIGGYAENSEAPIIGTGWHCDICNNFVVQITGVKRWIMVDPVYSLYMRPTMNNGKTAIAGGHISVTEQNLPYFPHHVVDLHPGDFLYNPEWYWHSIENQANGPFSFGLVSRQCHIKRNFKSNSIFTTMILLNHFVAGIYDPEARQRVWSALTGSSLMKPEEGVVVPKDRESGGYFSR